MKKAHKNEIFHLLQSCELGLENFELNESGPALDVVYLPFDKKFYFRATHSVNDFNFFQNFGIFYAPGFALQRITDGIVPIQGTVLNLKWWIDNHIRPFTEDQDRPDLYEEYKRGVNLSQIETIDYAESSNFTIEQKEQIRIGFEELKLLIQNNYGATSDQMVIINQRLQYLLEATERLDRTDWKGIFISTVIGLVQTLMLTPERSQELINMFITILHVVPALFQHTPIR